MDPTLLFSSMFMLFFFGFNADTFFGSEEAGITTQSLIDRAAKSFCGSTLLYGINHLTGILWEQYNNATALKLERINHSPTITAAANSTTPIATTDGMKQLGDNVPDQTPDNDTRWNEVCSEPDPNPPTSKLFEQPKAEEAQPLYMSRGMESFSTYADDTLARPVLESTANQVDLNAYLTKYDFCVFVFCVLLPGLFLWATRRPKKRPERTQGVTTEGQPTYCLSCLAGNVVQASQRNPQVSAQPLVTERLDEILALLKVTQNKNDWPSQLGQGNAVEPGSLREILDTAVSNNTSQVQDLELLRRGQERIERQIPDLKAVEERINRRFDKVIQEIGSSWQREVANFNTVNVQKRLENLEENSKDCVELIEKIQEELLPALDDEPESPEDLMTETQAGKKMLLKEKLQWHKTLIDAMTKRFAQASTEINSRLEEIEQVQKQTSVPSDFSSKLEDLDKRVEEVQKQASVPSDLASKIEDLDKRVRQTQKQAPAPDYMSRIQELETRIKHTEKRISQYPDFANKLNELTRRVAQLKEEKASLSEVEDLLQTLEEKVQHDNTLMNASFRQSLDAHDERINTLNEKVGKTVSEQQVVGKLQQTLDTHDKEIGTLKGKVEEFESEQRGMDQRIRLLSEQKPAVTTENLESLEKTVKNRIIEKSEEIKAQLEQELKDFDELRIRLDVVESYSEEHRAEFKNIRSRLTAQEEQHTEAKVQELAAMLAKTTETIDSLQNLHLQEKDGLESMFSAKVEGLDTQISEVKNKAADIQVEVNNLKREVYVEALHGADAVQGVGATVIARVTQLELDISMLIAQLDFFMRMDVDPNAGLLPDLSTAPQQEQDIDANIRSAQPPDIAMAENVGNLNDGQQQAENSQEPMPAGEDFDKVFEEFLTLNEAGLLQGNPASNTAPPADSQATEQPASSERREIAAAVEENLSRVQGSSVSESQWATPSQPNEDWERLEAIRTGFSTIEGTPLDKSRWAEEENDKSNDQGNDTPGRSS